jgi:hypothetical protein
MASAGGSVTSKRLCAREIRCDLYVTYELGKWSGRLDSNQRPLRPSATSCDYPRFSATTTLQAVDSEADLKL